jgi:NTE family protein
MKKIINTLILSGGGVKGISYIGALKYLDELKKVEEYDINIKEILGVSVGSIIGLLYILGYTYDELVEEIISKNLSDLKELRIKNFLQRYGFDSGIKIINWIETLIIRKGYSKDITFSDIYANFGVNFRVVATNLNKYKTVAFDKAVSPLLRVTRAIRMSIGIPLVFTVTKYRGECYVDGGLINNYPIKEYHGKLDNVLGLKLVTRGEFHEMDEPIDSFYNYLRNLITCYMVQKERETTLSYKYRDHSIGIEAQSITNTINFSLNEEQKRNLIDIGYAAAKDYFEKDDNSLEEDDNSLEEDDNRLEEDDNRLEEL